MDVIFVRHGLTAWNLAKKIQGHVDIPLAPEGVRQAERAAEALRGEPLTVIYQSPLIRTVQTADCIARWHPGCPRIDEPRLIERDFGGYEGMARTDFDYAAIWDYSKNEHWRGAEPVRDCFARVWSFLDTLKGKEGTALLVSHGGVSVPVKYYGQDMAGVGCTVAAKLHHGEIYRFTV